MATFVDDNNNKVKAVTAEQHALDNPGHIVTVQARRTRSKFFMLITACHSCAWWNEEGYK
jgi:hypothetical protein